MRILVNANEQQQAEWLQKGFPQDVEVSFVHMPEPDFSGVEADCIFHLAGTEEAGFTAPSTTPVFVHAVAKTLRELPANSIRINAWNGFLNRQATEIAADASDRDIVAAVMDALQWKYFFVPDIPGMIAARTISMIVNEAYFALGEQVSTKEAIDTAMRLGTNYPYGPFEWAERIGIHHIYTLLLTMQSADPRCTIAPLLQQEAAALLSTLK